MTTRSRPSIAAEYRNAPDRLAQSRTQPAEPSTFDRELALWVRRLRFSVPDLNEYELGLLEDYGRGASVDGEVRYRLLTFKALMAIASRSPRVEDRDGLPAIVRAEIERNRPALDIATAFDLETPAPGAADVEQRAFERDMNPITWARCKQALARQLATTRAAYDAVIGWGSKNLHTRT